MTKCTKCKGEIAQLLFTSASIESGHFDRHGKYIDICDGGASAVRFMCPHCGLHLFNNEDDAYEFLNP